jgi:hypothetical protein
MCDSFPRGCFALAHGKSAPHRSRTKAPGIAMNDDGGFAHAVDEATVSINQ